MLVCSLSLTKASRDFQMFLKRYRPLFQELLLASVHLLSRLNTLSNDTIVTRLISI